MKKPAEVAVIGAGLVGLATAREILKRKPGVSLVLFEKENSPGQHQSTHNSGVLHAGLYYKPGSLKARLAVSGIRMMTAYCSEKSIPHEICGKVVVATDEAEAGRLRDLHERGKANGLDGLRWLGPEELREIEPHAAGIAALHVPQEGIVDYDAVCRALLADIVAAGGAFVPNARVVELAENDSGWRIGTTSGEFEARYLVNCAGLFCDRVARLAGVREKVRIVPFRGEYFKLSSPALRLVKNLIYPVPDPKFPFLGVHFTRLIHGGIEAGPNAVLAFAREAYTKWQFSVPDMADAFSFPGLWKFLGEHPAMCAGELLRSFSRELFAKSLQKLVPDIRAADLEPGGAGVRAQAMSRDGTLVNDFWLVERDNALHILNAPSPAATASLAIAEEVVSKMPMFRWNVATSAGQKI